MSYYRKESHTSTPFKYPSSSQSLLSSVLSFILLRLSKINTILEMMNESEFTRSNESEETTIQKYVTALHRNTHDHVSVYA